MKNIVTNVTFFEKFGKRHNPDGTLVTAKDAVTFKGMINGSFISGYCGAIDFSSLRIKIGNEYYRFIPLNPNDINDVGSKITAINPTFITDDSKEINLDSAINALIYSKDVSFLNPKGEREKVLDIINNFIIGEDETYLIKQY